MRKNLLRFVLLGILLFTLLQQYTVVKAQERDCQGELIICLAQTYDGSGCQSAYAACMRGTPPKQNPPVVLGPGGYDYEWMLEFFDF